MAETDVWTMLGWVILALVLKLGLFFVAGFTSYRRSKKSNEISSKYKVVQTGAKTAGKVPVLVTGGTGFLGRHIVDMLLERFSDVIDVSVFDVCAKADPNRPIVTYIQGDVRSPSHVDAALTGKAAVIHCVGIMEMAGTDLNMMRAVNVEGTKNVVESCLEHDVKAMVFTSSVAVHYRLDNDDMVDIKEDAITPPESSMVFEYSRLKRHAERLVLAANGHAIKTVSLRPGGIHGRGDVFLTDLVSNWQPVIGYHNKRVPYCWVRDVARAHVLALLRLLAPTLPNAEVLVARAAEPWLCPASAWDDASGSAWGYKVRDDPHFNAVFCKAPSAAHTNGDSTNGKANGETNGHSKVAGAVAVVGNGVAAAAKGGASIAGRAFHLVYDPEVEAPRFRQINGASEPEGSRLNAYGWPAKWTLPLWIVELMCPLNVAVGTWFGVPDILKHMTPSNMRWVKRDGVFDISQAKHVLGWQPVPWRTVVRVIAAEVEAERANKKRVRSENV